MKHLTKQVGRTKVGIGSINKKGLENALLRMSGSYYSVKWKNRPRNIYYHFNIYYQLKQTTFYKNKFL